MKNFIIGGPFLFSRGLPPLRLERLLNEFMLPFSSFSLLILSKSLDCLIRRFWILGGYLIVLFLSFCSILNLFLALFTFTATIILLAPLTRFIVASGVGVSSTGVKGFSIVLFLSKIVCLVFCFALFASWCNLETVLNPKARESNFRTNVFFLTVGLLF